MRSSSLVLLLADPLQADPLQADPLQADPGLTASLITALRNSFRSIRTVRSLEDLRSTVASHRAVVVIVDMEIVSLADVARLSNDFSGLRIVCIHRLADEELWTAALSAGAADLCPSADTSAILAAVHRGGRKHPTAA
jgi:DNA-binding NarL/FixJ family response regulator